MVVTVGFTTRLVWPVTLMFPGFRVREAALPTAQLKVVLPPETTVGGDAVIVTGGGESI